MPASARRTCGIEPRHAFALAVAVRDEMLVVVLVSRPLAGYYGALTGDGDEDDHYIEAMKQHELGAEECALILSDHWKNSATLTPRPAMTHSTTALPTRRRASGGGLKNPLSGDRSPWRLRSSVIADAEHRSSLPTAIAEPSIVRPVESRCTSTGDTR